MGMYDDIKVLVPLPDGFDGKNFQSKDLECLLDQYEIRKDGTLWKLVYELVDNPNYDKEKPPFAVGNALFKRENEHWVQEDFHGFICFYGMGESNEWHEYVAKFTDGKLVEIQTDKQT